MTEQPTNRAAATGAMPQTEAALRRLGAAIERLEVAAAQAQSGDLLLAGELRVASDERARLEDTSQMVAARLDEAIVRLRGLLGE